ncbi:single-stranded-DNA-specific exonuclease RecJ [Acuticoccus sp. MNP-M23]|uniref:single-stranded-DNA-specific exonuclease RecJ n=1 Tax=Acuticoccus sp. MNP-M23 TaxID=3072793 RepID=UPI0028159031|nr:single-stranded-DNA-specific exonuclease RecJ [Acuticoccus sp. MNP-M23]WMS42868.1 single-stranded-DNA-specific exonuclease RecJ [Acuticoccus sp. MNP-M23]
MADPEECDRTAVLAVERSMTGRSWVRRLAPAEERTALALAQRHGLPHVVASVLAGRGMTTENAETELAPTMRALMPDPSTLTDCDALVARLADAVTAAEPVAIFSDYDVDGATAAAVVARVLRAYGREPRVMIPDRVSDGYGPSVALMETLVADGARVVLCLDCGSGAIEPVAAAKAAGADVLVIDHHPVDTLAAADAVVNPNRADDLSGLGHCAAVGVAFVAMVGLVRELKRRGVAAPDGPPDLMALLDCVALGTVADVVPLSGLNRAFVRTGLQTFRRRGNRGLAALVTVARLGGPVDAEHLGYVLGPRINAGGRIGDSGLGARLLLTENDAEAEEIAATLDGLNADRRAMERRALEEAVAMADESAPVVVVAGDWHPGVVGLVAARLKERTRHPAIAIALGDGQGVGSGRSMPGVDLGAAIRKAAADGLLVKGGGHPMAAGLTVEIDKIPDLTSFLTAALGESVAEAAAADQLKIDAVVGLRALDVTLAQTLEAHGPWGSSRPKPVLALDDVVLERVQPVGQGDSLRLTLRSLCGARATAMAFRAGGPLGARLKASAGEAVHLAVELSHGVFRGEDRAEIIVLDAAAANTAMQRAA